MRPEQLNRIRTGDPASVRIIPSVPLNKSEQAQFGKIEEVLRRPVIHREITQDILDMGMLWPGDCLLIKQLKKDGNEDELLRLNFPARGSASLLMNGNNFPLSIPDTDKLSLFSAISVSTRDGELSLFSFLRDYFSKPTIRKMFFSIENQGVIVPGENGPVVSRPVSEKGILLNQRGRYMGAWLDNEAEGFLFDYHVHPGLTFRASKDDHLGKIPGDRFELLEDYEYFAPQIVFDRIGRGSLHAPAIFRPYHPSERLAKIRDFYNAFFIKARVTGFELK